MHKPFSVRLIQQHISSGNELSDNANAIEISMLYKQNIHENL